MFQLLVGLLSIGLVQAQIPLYSAPAPLVLSEKIMSLEDRYQDRWVNSVFSDNILLSIAYLRTIQSQSKDVNWDEVHKTFSYSFTLKPQEVFAFHPDVLPEFEGKVVKTIYTDFGSDQGYRSDGFLYGDGVCHMASLLNWVAATAGLHVVAPRNHDFAHIPDIDRQYGTSIYYSPGQKTSNALQNLYIQNNKENPVTITISYNGKSVDAKVSEVIN